MDRRSAGGAGQVHRTPDHRGRRPVDDAALTKSFEARVDPDVLKDGLTVADLVEQQNFLLQVRDTMAEARLPHASAAGDAEGQCPAPPSPVPASGSAR